MNKQKTEFKSTMQETLQFDVSIPGWYYLDTNNQFIYKIPSGEDLKLNEDGEPIGYIERRKIRATR